MSEKNIMLAVANSDDKVHRSRPCNLNTFRKKANLFDLLANVFGSDNLEIVNKKFKDTETGVMLEGKELVRILDLEKLGEKEDKIKDGFQFYFLVRMNGRIKEIGLPDIIQTGELLSAEKITVGLILDFLESLPSYARVDLIVRRDVNKTEDVTREQIIAGSSSFDSTADSTFRIPRFDGIVCSGGISKFVLSTETPRMGLFRGTDDDKIAFNGELPPPSFSVVLPERYSVWDAGISVLSVVDNNFSNSFFCERFQIGYIFFQQKFSIIPPSFGCHPDRISDMLMASSALLPNSLSGLQSNGNFADSCNDLPYESEPHLFVSAEVEVKREEFKNEKEKNEQHKNEQNNKVPKISDTYNSEDSDDSNESAPKKLLRFYFERNAVADNHESDSPLAPPPVTSASRLKKALSAALKNKAKSRQTSKKLAGEKERGQVAANKKIGLGYPETRKKKKNMKNMKNTKNIRRLNPLKSAFIASGPYAMHGFSVYTTRSRGANPHSLTSHFMLHGGPSTKLMKKSRIRSEKLKNQKTANRKNNANVKAILFKVSVQKTFRKKDNSVSVKSKNKKNKKSKKSAMMNRDYKLKWLLSKKPSGKNKQR